MTQGGDGALGASSGGWGLFLGISHWTGLCTDPCARPWDVTPACSSQMQLDTQTQRPGSRETISLGREQVGVICVCAIV